MYLPQIIETITPQRTTNLLLIIVLRGKSVCVCACARVCARCLTALIAHSGTLAAGGEERRLNILVFALICLSVNYDVRCVFCTDQFNGVKVCSNLLMLLKVSGVSFKFLPNNFSVSTETFLFYLTDVMY